jgi:hypothetical protein
MRGPGKYARLVAQNVKVMFQVQHLLASAMTVLLQRFVVVDSHL